MVWVEFVFFKYVFIDFAVPNLMICIWDKLIAYSNQFLEIKKQIWKIVFEVSDLRRYVAKVIKPSPSDHELNFKE